MQSQERLGVVDVGGSHLHAALVRADGAGLLLEDRVRADVDAAADREPLLAALAEPLRRLRATTWVVALPGPFDYPAGRGDFAGVGKFGALAGVDLRSELASRVDVRPDQLHFLNDAQAYGLGEWWATSSRRPRSVCLTLGTGVGSVFVVEGVPVEAGPGVPPHGWVHLLTLDGRPLEDTVSTRAIRAAYLARSGRRVDVRAVADAAREGDGTARDVLATAMRDLARAAAPNLAAFGADELVIGGSIARSWDLLGEPLASALHASPGLADLEVRPSELLDDAPLLGAAWWFRRVRSESPAPTP